MTIMLNEKPWNFDFPISYENLRTAAGLTGTPSCVVHGDLPVGSREMVPIDRILVPGQTILQNITNIEVTMLHTDQA